jgi:hypothetical protein
MSNFLGRNMVCLCSPDVIFSMRFAIPPFDLPAFSVKEGAPSYSENRILAAGK